MRQELGIRARVRLVEPRTIPDSPDERRKVIDRRDKVGEVVSATLPERH
jgi:hypothetical protein